MIKRYTKTRLNRLSLVGRAVTKQDAFKSLRDAKVEYDGAVPQPWLDDFTKRHPELEYWLVLSSTVWVYGAASPYFGMPCSCCTEVQDAINKDEQDKLKAAGYRG